jgi:hypothetical protein
MGCLVDVSQPPLTPTVHSATKPAALFANNVLPVYAALPSPPPAIRPAMGTGTDWKHWGHIGD